MPEFPSNSQNSKNEPRKEELKKITTGRVSEKKKSFGKRVLEAFGPTETDSIFEYIFFEVLLPNGKELLDEVFTGMKEIFIWGALKGRPSNRDRQNPYHQYTSYNKMREQKRELSGAARSRHDFNEIVFDSLGEAQEVLDALVDLVDRYEMVFVRDLYQLAGLSFSHTDERWGWDDLRRASVERLRGGGYLLDLPRPKPLK